MIVIRTTGMQSVIQTLATGSQQLRISLHEVMQRIGVMLQRHIQRDKLAGQVLAQRSGKLVRSVHQEVLVEDNVYRTVVSAGALAPYAWVHEHGGTFQIPEHMSMSRLGRAYTVRAHMKTYPERSFMRSGLADMQYDAVRMIEEALRGRGFTVA